MKTKNTTIKLLEKDQGYAAAVKTLGIYKSNELGTYEWGIFHNGIGVRWYCIYKSKTRHTFIHVYEYKYEMLEYVKSNIR